MIIALAGRRIDAESAESPRFPAKNEARVREAIAAALRRVSARFLVCSAACGADILALEAAEELGIARRVVLPFSRALFRKTSVADRGERWGQRYDHILTTADVVELSLDPKDAATYTTTNVAIFEQATAQGRELHQPLMAFVVWNVESRGASDVTAAFLEEAQRREIPVEQIQTLKVD